MAGVIGGYQHVVGQPEQHQALPHGAASPPPNMAASQVNPMFAWLRALINAYNYATNNICSCFLPGTSVMLIFGAHSREPNIGL